MNVILFNEMQLPVKLNDCQYLTNAAWRLRSQKKKKEKGIDADALLLIVQIPSVYLVSEYLKY